MSNYMGDITNYLIPAGNTSTTKRATSSNNIELDMTDFLTLMVTELTNQSIDQTADTSDMLNQMVQMQMIQAITNMTDASIMSYAASLVGKEVTVGQFDADGNLQEIVGTVQGTGTMNGQQVVFVDDKYYYMNEIMAVGRLPKTEEDSGAGDNTDGDNTGGDGTGNVDGSGDGSTGGGNVEGPGGGTEGTGGTESGGSENQDETADPGAAEQ